MPRDALAEIKALTVSTQHCKLWEALQAIEPSLLEGVNSAMEVQEIPSTAIARWLRAEGLNVSDNTVLRHRKEVCACRRTKI